VVQALVIRRFNVKTNGTAHVVEAARQLDLPILPPHGYVLAFEDGSGEAGVAGMRLRAWPSPRPPGVYPVPVEIRTGAELAGRLGNAPTAGWTKVEQCSETLHPGGL
jgi:hypothetical protein